MFSRKNESEIAFAARFFSLITWIAKLQIKQLVERPLQILTHYEHKSWIALQLLWFFFEAFKISWFIGQRKHPETTQLRDRCFPKIFGILFKNTCYEKVLFCKVSLEIF